MRRIIIFVLTFIIVNVAFVAMHYYADLRSPALVKERINQAMKTANLSDHNYTVFDFGYPSLFSTIGADHFTDCFIDMMAMYRDDDPVKNAVIPGFLTSNDSNLCKLRADIAAGKNPAQALIVKTKPRLWHGAKVFMLLALPRLDYFQINHLIKLTTYFLYGFMGIMIALLARSIIWSYLPIMLSGIFASGIVIHGGISNAIPYLWSITGISMLLFLTYLGKLKLTPIFTMIMGCILAFIYVTDGSLMLALPMLAFSYYFVIFQQQQPLWKFKQTVFMLVLFMAGFAGSLVFKQLISMMYQDNVWQSFVDTVFYRISGDHKGQALTPAHSIASQLKWYHLATLGWKELAVFLKWAGLASWLAATCLALLSWIRYQNISAIFDLIIFLIAPAVVFARYAIIANHSSIHVIIVSRYLSVALCFGIAAMVYFIIKTRHDLTSQSREA